MTKTLELVSRNQTTLLKFQLIYQSQCLRHIYIWMPNRPLRSDVPVVRFVTKVIPSESQPHYSCLWRSLPHGVWVGLCNMLNPINAEVVGGASSSPEPWRPGQFCFCAFGALNHPSSGPATMLKRPSRETTWESHTERSTPGHSVPDFQPPIPKY